MCDAYKFISKSWQKFMVSVWLKCFRGDRGGDTFKTSSLYEKLLPLSTPCFKMLFQKLVRYKTEFVQTQSTISFQKSDLYDNGTMSFTCEHSPNWQVFCPQIMAAVTLAFFPVVWYPLKFVCSLVFPILLNTVFSYGLGIRNDWVIIALYPETQVQSHTAEL